MVGRITQDHLGGIARHEQHAERHDTDSENDDEGLKQATNYIAHGWLTLSSYWGARHSWIIIRDGMRPNASWRLHGIEVLLSGSGPSQAGSGN